MKKFSRIASGYFVYIKDIRNEGSVFLVPVFMTKYLLEKPRHFDPVGHAGLTLLDKIRLTL